MAINNKHCLYYSEEEMHNFSMEFLRRKCDDKATLSKKEMCRFLHYQIFRISKFKMINGQIVSDDNGKFFRIHEESSHDERLGISVPVVLDLEIGNYYSHIEDLFPTKAIYFSDRINSKNKLLIQGIVKTINYFSINDTIYDISEIYVLDDDVARLLISSEKYVKIKKK